MGGKAPAGHACSGSPRVVTPERVMIAVGAPGKFDSTVSPCRRNGLRRAWTSVGRVPTLAGLVALLAVAGCSSYVTFEGCEADSVCRLLEHAVDVELHKKVDLEPDKPVNLKYEEGILCTDYSLSCGVETWGDRITARVGQTGYNVLHALLPWRSEAAEKRILGFVAEAVLRRTDAEVVDSSPPFLKRLRPIPGGDEKNVSAATLYGVTQNEVVACLGKEGAVSYIGPGLEAHTSPVDKTARGVKVTWFDSWVVFLADYYTFEVETIPVSEGVRVSVRGKCHVSSEGWSSYKGPLKRPVRNRSLRSVVIYLLDRLPHASLGRTH